MAHRIRMHMMFDGTAEEAMDFYVSLFPESVVHSAQRYDSGDNQGKLQHGSFSDLLRYRG